VSSQLAQNMLVEQRRRLVGTLMRYLEEEVYPGLSLPQQKELRKKVLTATAQYHDVCLDLIKASVNDGTVLDEQAMRLLTLVHADVRSLRKDP
jgi:hypothetical protein